MNIQDLKDYVSKAKELESLIYTQENLKPLYLNEIDKEVISKMPPVPQTNFPNAPDKPIPPDRLNLIVGIIFLIPSFILTMAFIIDYIERGEHLLGLILSSIGALIGAVLLDGYHNGKKLYNEQMERYDIYQRKCDKEAERYKIVIQEYDKKFAEYEVAKEKSVEHKNKISTSFDETTSILKNTLNELYDKNIIFPKYRNFIAITMISEYLESGRCSELEGPNGAYNLYESELRQNIIINQLSTIIDNLEQIKSNQFVLYQEISNSNRIIGSLLVDIHNELALSNYFAETIAKAAVAPRVGVIF